jgi:hypothetical protein
MRRKSDIRVGAESAKPAKSKGASSSGDSVRRPLGFFALMTNPSELSSPLGLSVSYRTPASWPRKRRSACVPAEAYPPLRSLVVYPRMQSRATMERKNSLIFAALSDEELTGQPAVGLWPFGSNPVPLPQAQVAVTISTESCEVVENSYTAGPFGTKSRCKYAQYLVRPISP